MDPKKTDELENQETPVEDDNGASEILAALEAEMGPAPADDDGIEEPEALDEPEIEAAADDEPETKPEVEEGDEPEVEAAAEEKEEEPEVEAAEEPKPEVKAEEKEARPSDEFGDLPENTNEKTRERFNSLRSKFDEVHNEYEGLKSEYNGLVDTIKSTGTTGEQFNMLLEYAKLVNSRDPSDWQKAHGIMQAEMQTLSRALGREAPGVDPLEAHPDLQQEVEAGDISKERALELAHMRATRHASETNREHQQQESQQQNVRTQALRDLNQLGVELAKDPMFHVKQPVLQQIANLVVKNEPDPSKWKAHIQEAYNKIQAPQAAAPAPAPTPKSPTPIRPGGAGPTGSSLTKEPGSVMEAVNMALDSM